MLQVLYFSTKVCGPCKVYAPIVQQASAETGINITKVDAHEQPSLAAQMSISSVPTIVFIKDGVEIGRLGGARSKQELIGSLTKYSQ